MLKRKKYDHKNETVAGSIIAFGLILAYVCTRILPEQTYSMFRMLGNNKVYPRMVGTALPLLVSIVFPTIYFKRKKVVYLFLGLLGIIGYILFIFANAY